MIARHRWRWERTMDGSLRAVAAHVRRRHSWWSDFFFFSETAPTEIYTLSLHDALPILDPGHHREHHLDRTEPRCAIDRPELGLEDRKSTRLNSSHVEISYAVFCLK